MNVGGPASFGQFRLARSLGRDALSESFLARTPRSEAPIVALRIFKSSAETLRTPEPQEPLQHPNLVFVFERGAIDGRGYIASEYTLGKNIIAIRDRIRRERAGIAVSIVVRLLADGLTALVWLHEKSAHVAISPNNFFVTSGGVAKLADVGLPLELHADRAHLAPEIRAGSPLTSASDLYGLAATIDYLLASIPHVSPTLSALLASMLASDPGARPASARDALKDLLTGTAHEHAPASRVIAGRWLSDLFAEERKIEVAELEVLKEREPTFGDEEPTSAEAIDFFEPEPTFVADELTERGAAPRSARKNTMVLVEEDDTNPRAQMSDDPTPELHSLPTPTRSSTPTEPRAFGGYRMLSKIGEGGMSEVHRAEQFVEVTGSRPCVIKRLDSKFRDDPEYKEMFGEEARIAQVLKHPNIVECLDAGSIDGVGFITFELVDGLDLAELIHELHPDRLPVGAALEIIKRVARALDYAHNLKDEQGKPLTLVHRDVSPENILISWTGEVKLLDFGLSKFEGRSFHTRAGIMKGKLSYMAPEQLDIRRVDARTDLYQLGVVLAEAIAGRKVFGPEALLMRPKDHAQIRSHLEQHLSVAGVMPDALLHLLTRLCAFDPNERPQSAFEVATELEAIQSRLNSSESLETIIRARAPSDIRRAETVIEPEREQTLVKSGSTVALVVMMVIALLMISAIVAWLVANELSPQ